MSVNGTFSKRLG